MSKRVVISLIAVDKEWYNYKGELVYRRRITTNMSVERIWDLLDFGPGFSLNIVYGKTISFIDLHSIDVERHEQIIGIINTIPESDEIPNIDKTRRVVIKNMYIGDEDIVIDKNLAFIITDQKYDMGAFDISKSILFILNDPYANFAISYLVGKWLDWLLGLVKRFIPFFPQSKREDQGLIYANIRKIYKNAAIAIKRKVDDLQIILLEKEELNQVKVVIRTCEDETYQFLCSANGKIHSFRMLNGSVWEILSGENEMKEYEEEENL